VRVSPCWTRHFPPAHQWTAFIWLPIHIPDGYLGPWAASISITVALVIQAILLGDGGISAIGVDCLNIAALHPFSGWPSIASPRGNLPSL